MGIDFLQKSLDVLFKTSPNWKQHKFLSTGGWIIKRQYCFTPWVNLRNKNKYMQQHDGSQRPLCYMRNSTQNTTYSMTILISTCRRGKIVRDQEQISGCLQLEAREMWTAVGHLESFKDKRTILYLDCGISQEYTADTTHWIVHVKWMKCISLKLMKK